MTVGAHMRFEKRRLNKVDKDSMIQLLTHPSVQRHMPLSTSSFGEKEYATFIAAKEKIWEKHGFGPSAYFVDDQFIGWAGIQPDEGDDFEIAIVLSPQYWGYGKQIYKELIQYAFAELKLPSVTILFPPSRTRIKGILKAGFIEEGEVLIDGERFFRYRLINKFTNQ